MRAGIKETTNQLRYPRGQWTDLGQQLTGSMVANVSFCQKIENCRYP